jgi:hypothetical protein
MGMGAGTGEGGRDMGTCTGMGAGTGEGGRDMGTCTGMGAGTGEGGRGMGTNMIVRTMTSMTMKTGGCGVCGVQCGFGGCGFHPLPRRPRTDIIEVLA